MNTPIRRFNPPGLFDSSVNHHSQVSVVEPGELAFFSGQVAWRPDGTPPPDSHGEQTKIVMDHLRTCLDSVGATQDDIVALRVYVVDWTPDKSEAIFAPLADFLDGVEPSITGVGVQVLAGPKLLIEVEMVARVPG
ncbi:Endoribonuclease L-PSP [Plesiocystis pacifica SIR-1]|uniref:Endoribonuclease L-PSP n=1 Tax=Plesiocystis pacifica SIR-1 TaxID=391625 RepID=A6G3S8_9BACT|nr:RidA family protein [Plesiocystis pacifica]EDM79465.1 Endoribonuclease L-PSP [Plesiocystis pacifica SIR-1]